MQQKKLNFFSISLTFLLLLSAGLMAATGQADDIKTDFQIEEDIEIVYEVTRLRYNVTEKSIPVGDDEGDSDGDERDKIIEGDLLFFEIRELPDLEVGEEGNVTLGMRGSHIDRTADIEYSPQVPYEWPNETDGPVFWLPVVPVPDPIDPQADSNWTEIAANWDAVAGISATNNATHFELTGANSTLNVTKFTASWNKANGVLEYYWFNTTWGPDSNGSNAWPAEMELVFQYFRDWRDFDLGWGISEGALAVWRIDTLSYDGMPYMPIKLHEGEDLEYLYEGDVAMWNFDELWDPETDERSPHYNGSFMTTTFSDYMTFYLFGDDRDEGASKDGDNMASAEQESDSGGGSSLRFNIPLFLTGNDMLFANFTDELEHMGDGVNFNTSAGYNSTHFWVDFDIDDPEGGYMYENAIWDRASGYIQEYSFDGFQWNDTHHIPLVLEYHFLYNLSASILDWNWGIGEGFSQRYIITQMQNGTNNYLDMGSEQDPFRLYEGDVVVVSFYNYVENVEGEPDHWQVYLRTNHGYKAEMKYNILPPGLEAAIEGPPAMYFAYPVDSSTWWDLLEDTFTTAGYAVTNDASTFGIEGEVLFPKAQGPEAEGDSPTEIYLNIEWNKTDGVLEYYCIEANMSDGTPLIWEMQRGVSINVSTINWEWGVNVGHQMTYRFDKLLIGSSTSMPFSETGTINEGDDIYLTITALGILTGSEPYVGAIANAWANGATQENIEFSFPEPGFELVDWYDRIEEEDGEGPQPFLYIVFPVGDAAYWSFITDLYEEVGYEVSDYGDNYEIKGNIGEIEYFEVRWNKITGVMMFYELQLRVADGSLIHLKLSLIAEGESPPTGTASTASEESSTATIPAFEAVFVLPILAALLLVIRRRR